MRNILLLGLFIFVSIFLFGNDVSAHHSIFHVSEYEVVQDTEESGLQEVLQEENRGFTFPIVVLAGLVDGSNICGLTLLLLFVGYLAIHVKDRKRSMKIGFIYLGTIFITYFLVGILFSNFVSSLLEWEYYQLGQQVLNDILIVLLMLAGILNFQDFFFHKKFIFEVDTQQRNKFRSYLKKVDIPTTIGLGVVSVMFLLPCSLPLYLGAVSSVTQLFGQSQALWYIFVYCLFFIVPLLITFAVILRTEKVVSDKNIHSGRYRYLKLVKGFIQIGAALGLYFIFF